MSLSLRLRKTYTPYILHLCFLSQLWGHVDIFIVFCHAMAAVNYVSFLPLAVKITLRFICATSGFWTRDIYLLYLKQHT